MPRHPRGRACRRQRRHQAPASSAGSTICPTVCADYEIDRVIVAFPNTSDAIVLEALRKLEGQVPVSEIPRYFELHNWRTEAEELHGLTLMHLPTVSLAASERIIKRLMDITLATCALVIAAPVLLITALAIKLDTRGPVSSVRSGLAGPASHFGSSSSGR